MFLIGDTMKVMIVDDERMVRELLKICINWEEMGLAIVGEAACAEEGIEMADSLMPDIIITDICMPVMDGLEFSRRIAEKHPGIKTVILTGHEEFEYAKKGIKVGISDFLLKPVNDDEIKKTMLAVKEKIIRERMKALEYERAVEQLRQNLPYLREKILNELIQGGVGYDVIKEKAGYFGIKIEDKAIQVAVIEVFDPGEGSDSDEEGKMLLRIRCLELVRQYFNTVGNVHVFFDNSQRIIILFNDGSKVLWECCDFIRSMVTDRLKCCISVGVGNKYDLPDRARISYKEACDALKYRHVAGNNQVIAFSDICMSGEGNAYIDFDLINSYCFYLKSGIKDKAREVIGSVFRESGAGAPTKEQISVFACNFVAGILNVLMESGIELKDVFEKSLQPIEKIFKLDTLPEIREYLSLITDNVIIAVNGIKKKKVRKIIKDVKEYIDNNFASPDLTLSEVARKFYVNLSFLSRIFKEETGLTFVDYLTKLRMEKAIRLFDETDKKAYQIAEEVGIDDPQYFSVCFKKYTGVSVNQYKKAR